MFRQRGWDISVINIFMMRWRFQAVNFFLHLYVVFPALCNPDYDSVFDWRDCRECIQMNYRSVDLNSIPPILRSSFASCRPALDDACHLASPSKSGNVEEDAEERCKASRSFRWLATRDGKVWLHSACRPADGWISQTAGGCAVEGSVCYAKSSQRRCRAEGQKTDRPTSGPVPPRVPSPFVLCFDEFSLQPNFPQHLHNAQSRLLGRWIASTAWSPSWMPTHTQNLFLA